jgi:hypothetical protein
MSREAELAAQGWQKQATTDDPRLSEMVELYAELGFEIHLEPFRPEAEPGCTGCLAAFPDRYKTIYTRKREGSS